VYADGIARAAHRRLEIGQQLGTEHQLLGGAGENDPHEGDGLRPPLQRDPVGCYGTSVQAHLIFLGARRRPNAHGLANHREPVPALMTAQSVVLRLRSVSKHRAPMVGDETGSPRYAAERDPERRLETIRKEDREIETALANFADDLPAIAQEFGIERQDALAAVRMALTGQKDGPPLALIFPLLGHDRMLIRIGAVSSRLLHGRGLEPIQYGPDGKPFLPIEAQKPEPE